MVSSSPPRFSPEKPQKPRIVFYCAAQFDDVSLNKRLLQGPDRPDMTNKLIGVLTRFREDATAFMADIESMFCQVRVSPEQRDYLRFLWWKDGDYEQVMEEYQMLVHVFGATSSPICAGFCLQKAASDFEGSFDSSTIETIRKNFCVDDCLRSVPSPKEAIHLIKEQIGWDEEIPQEMSQLSDNWLKALPQFENIAVPRYLKSHPPARTSD